MLNLINQQAKPAATTSYLTKLTQNYILCIGLFSSAFANAVDLQGGLKGAEDQIQIISTGIGTIVGVMAGVYLLFIAVQCWGGKQEWTAMIPALIKVAVAGGAITAAAWAFKLLA